MASTYGAAGSLVVLIFWINLAAQIFLYGAEFTQVYACRYGSCIERGDRNERHPGRHEMKSNP